MHYKALRPGKYIAAAETGGKAVTLTIKSVGRENILAHRKDAKPEIEPVVYFMEIDRGWVLNHTNNMCLGAMFGKETDDWPGHRVTIHAEMVRFMGKEVEGIRVKGSPELTKPITLTIAMPSKRPAPRTLVPTGKPQGENNGE